MLTQSLLLLDGFQEEINKEKYAHKISLNSNLNYCTPPPPTNKKNKKPHSPRGTTEETKSAQDKFNFIDCSRIVLQGKLWYLSGKDFFGNEQINSHNIVITYTLTCSQQGL